MEKGQCELMHGEGLMETLEELLSLGKALDLCMP